MSCFVASGQGIPKTGTGQVALTEAMNQIKAGTDLLYPEHIKIVQVHVAIKSSADRVLAVFD